MNPVVRDRKWEVLVWTHGFYYRVQVDTEMGTDVFILRYENLLVSVMSTYTYFPVLPARMIHKHWWPCSKEPSKGTRDAWEMPASS